MHSRYILFHSENLTSIKSNYFLLFQKKEYLGLLLALNKFNLNTEIILTNNQEDEFLLEGKKVILKPVWKLIIENK